MSQETYISANNASVVEDLDMEVRLENNTDDSDSDENSDSDSSREVTPEPPVTAEVVVEKDSQVVEQEIEKPPQTKNQESQATEKTTEKTTEEQQEKESDTIHSNNDLVLEKDQQERPSVAPSQASYSPAKMYRHPYMDKFYITQEAYEAISLFVSPSEAIQKAKDTTSFVTYMAQKQKITHDKPYTSEKVDAAHDNTNTPPVQNIAPNKTQAIVSATSTLSQSSPPVHSQPTTSPITNTTTRATTTTTNTKVVANTKPAQPEFSLDALLMSISDRPTDPPVIPMIPAIPVPLESSLHVPSKRKTRSYKNKRQKKGTGDDPFHENEDTGSFMEISHVEHIPSDLEIAALAAGVDPT